LSAGFTRSELEVLRAAAPLIERLVLDHVDAPELRGIQRFANLEAVGAAG
jgi:hypothetical protein